MGMFERTCFICKYLKFPFFRFMSSSSTWMQFSVSMTFCWDWAAFDRGRFIIFVVFPVDLKHSVKLRVVICRYFLLISNSQWNSEPKSFLLHDRIIALSFSAAIGVLLVVLGCALEEYGWVERCWKFLEHYL